MREKIIPYNCQHILMVAEHLRSFWYVNLSNLYLHFQVKYHEYLRPQLVLVADLDHTPEMKRMKDKYLATWFFNHIN